MIHCQYIRACVCLCPYRLHKFNLVPIILEMEVTVKDPVSLFFVHCPFICWFSLAHSVSFTEVPNLTRKEWQKAENQKNVKSTNLSPWRSPRRTHGGQVTNRGVIAKKITTTRQKKWHLRACTQELGAGTLLNQLFPCRKLQDEVIEHGLTILADLGLPPFEETSMCHENLWCFNWVSSYPRGQIRPPKKWAWPNSSLISISAPRFRKTFVAAILVKTSSTPQNLRSKFQDSTPNPWCCAFVARIYQFLDAQFEIERLWCYV
jgi:hypothetical protein